MLHVATFNIFWYPESDVPDNVRSAEDEGRIAQVLKNLDAHAIVFQEILDLPRLQQLLAQVKDSLRLTSPEGDWLASGNVNSTHSMKIACAYDTDVLKLVDKAQLRDPCSERHFGGRRYPYALHLRHRDTDWAFTLVGIHCKSGHPVLDDPDNDPKREMENGFLAEWLAGEADTASGQFERPPTPDVLVLGDFNAIWEHDTMASLQTGALEPWLRPAPQVFRSLAADEPDPLLEGIGEHWTTYLDRRVIDHVLASPGMAPRLKSPPCIYAFDRDPAMDQSPPGDEHWLHQETSYQMGQGTMPNLYRISDHRPVRVSLEVG